MNALYFFPFTQKIYEKLKDTKGNQKGKSMKNRQYNGQMKKEKDKH